MLCVVWMKVSRFAASGCHGSRFVSGSDAASWTMVQKVEDGGVVVPARVANGVAAIAPARLLVMMLF